MTNKINKICPLLYTGWLSFKGLSEQRDSTEIECLGDQCGWWDPEAEECIIFSALKSFKDKTIKPKE